jgi:hypothetical protein
VRGKMCFEFFYVHGIVGCSRMREMIVILHDVYLPLKHLESKGTTKGSAEWTLFFSEPRCRV